MSAGPAAPLRLACIDSDAPPLFTPISAQGRRGFEPAVAELIGTRLGRPVQWVPVAWTEMFPALDDGRADAVLSGQGITAERLAQVDFTRPYAIFHESVLVRRGASVARPADLAGRRIAAIAHSTNMALAQTFAGARPVAFGENGSDDVYAEMLAALRDGTVDAVVDDDVVFVPLGDSDPDFELAFTVPTANRWGVAVARGNESLRAVIDDALERAIGEGAHRAAWEEWLPTLEYPFP